MLSHISERCFCEKQHELIALRTAHLKKAQRISSVKTECECADPLPVKRLQRKHSELEERERALSLKIRNWGREGAYAGEVRLKGPDPEHTNIWFQSHRGSSSLESSNIKNLKVKVCKSTDPQSQLVLFIHELQRQETSSELRINSKLLNINWSFIMSKGPVFLLL